MKSKKIFAFITFIIIAAASLTAQVKNYVGIVRPLISEKENSFLTKFADDLNSKGYGEISASVSSYLKGGFGSGFVYVASDGSNYVITNHHVLGNAEKASIEFETADGSTNKYENLSVILLDDEIDLAILTFENKQTPFKEGLKLYTGNIEDAMTVWSAGFPGLGKDPMWQLGNGIISNSKVKLPDLLNPEISTIIQHTAEVDPGNSGGPLLYKNGNSWEVVGINTWKTSNRQNTNFSIPVTVLEKMLLKVEESKTLESSASINYTDLASKKSAFMKLLDEEDPAPVDFVNFISLESVYKSGKNAFYSVMRSATADDRNMVKVITYYFPVEGLKCALAIEMLKENKESKKTKDYQWINEQGNWRISNPVEEVKTAEKSKKKKSTDFTFNGQSFFEFGTEGYIGFPGLNTALSFEGLVFPLLGHCFGFGLDIAYQDVGGENGWGLGSKIVLRLPLTFNDFGFYPIIAAGINSSFDTEKTYLTICAEGGMQFVWHYDYYVNPYIEAGYKVITSLENTEKSYHGVFLSVGYGMGL